MARLPIGLIIYRMLASLRTPFLHRRIVRRHPEMAERMPERLGRPSADRPKGQLIWLHASSAGKEAALCGLARRLGEYDPELSFLMTTERPMTHSGELPPRLIHQYAPLDAGRPIASFLDHWRPDILLWVGTKLRPALILESARRGSSMSLIDAATAPVDLQGWQRLASHALRAFDNILATDPGAKQAVYDAGATPKSVEVVGPLQEEAESLPHNNSERNAIGSALRARPVWLATSVHKAEDDIIVAAHKMATRVAHRLLLILSPADWQRGPDIAQDLANQGFEVALRSVEGEPDNSTDIFIADGEADLGLWYRLAPVSFMGNTLTNDGSGGRTPLEPAALGSAILHGPHTGRHAASYARFTEAGAARLVTSEEDLGDALATLLAPDKAATMAHAAWRVSTGGAEMNERVQELISEALEERQIE